jgi:hypothetical protein
VAATGRLRASTRNTRAFFMPYTVLLLKPGDALFEPHEVRDGHHGRNWCQFNFLGEKLVSGEIGVSSIYSKNGLTPVFAFSRDDDQPRAPERSAMIR